MRKEGPERLDAIETRCCIVGGGPAGMMLGYLLARRGIDVTVLESHLDFDREFRGDTVHPSTLEVLDQLGLADRLLEIPHTRLMKVVLNSPEGAFVLADLRGLKTKFPFVALIPQVRFLGFIADVARDLPNFHLIMGASADELIEEEGKVRGVRYQSREGRHEIRSLLTIAADGRHSRLRTASGFEPIKSSPPMDVLWFKLPRLPGETPETDTDFFIRPGRMLIRLNRGDYWQVGLVIPKGGFHTLKTAGLDSFKRVTAEQFPMIAGNLEALDDWKQVMPLVVESSRLKLWHRPGLLFIGDAAHVMSPVGGVGINYAIQDAVVASNVLAEPLRRGDLTDADLAKIQRLREWPTRVIQTFQGLMQKNLFGSEFQRVDSAASRPIRPPFFLRLPFVGSFIARILAFGPRRVRVEGDAVKNETFARVGLKRRSIQSD